jgi:hypothetical protein
MNRIRFNNNSIIIKSENENKTENKYLVYKELIMGDTIYTSNTDILNKFYELTKEEYYIFNLNHDLKKYSRDYKMKSMEIPIIIKKLMVVTNNYIKFVNYVNGHSNNDLFDLHMKKHILHYRSINHNCFEIKLHNKFHFKRDELSHEDKNEIMILNIYEKNN